MPVKRAGDDVEEAEQMRRLAGIDDPIAGLGRLMLLRAEGLALLGFMHRHGQRM